MIAKLVTHAPSRAAAIEAQATALDSFYIDGIRHNIPFLSALMHHPRWREGKLSTGFISEEFQRLAVGAPEGEIAPRLAAVEAAIDHVRRRAQSGRFVGQMSEPAGSSASRRGASWLDTKNRADVARDGRRHRGAACRCRRRVGQSASSVLAVDAGRSRLRAHQPQKPFGNSSDMKPVESLPSRQRG